MRQDQGPFYVPFWCVRFAGPPEVMQGGEPVALPSGGGLEPRSGQGGCTRVVYPRRSPVPSSPYAPKHRAVPEPSRPVAFAGPRHVGDRRRSGRTAVRSSIALSGLAAAATGVAVVAGVVHAPIASADFAGSLSAAAAPAAASHAVS